MNSKAIPFDSDALDSRRAIIRRSLDDAQEIEMIEAVWGSNPRFNDGVSYEFIRSEGRKFPASRCLVAASEFYIRNADRKFRAFRKDGNFFYLAAVWEPPMGDRPVSYRIITLDANSDVIRYQARHGAIIERRDAQKWLDFSVPEEELLLTPPAGIFLIEEILTKPVQTSMAF
ncbi:SOS response-associated peptidase family protein [Sphingobium yanoikuyae]|uniref:SOS response-associated peptidase family protein n=1 Tax=Sphingobium yanoikuyae TaxID=13690 RepID=UPI0022DDDC57|nr:SOS response-associated peptidase family protein [Sphingobium yanoikuyae]WBQ19246.1 SOS response-associated peptidase family protein [Sphingobium yanoikuyae]